MLTLFSIGCGTILTVSSREMKLDTIVAMYMLETKRIKKSTCMNGKKRRLKSSSFQTEHAI